MFDELATQRDEAAAQRDELATQREQMAARHEQMATRADELAQTLRRREETIKHLQRLLFGRRSERLSAEELGQLVLAYGGSDADATAREPMIPIPELADAEPEEVEPGKPKKRRRHRGRTKLSPDLERRVTKTLVPEGERCCQTCGVEMVCIGFVDHECVGYEPAKLYVDVESCETLVCKTPGCKNDAATADREQAPAMKTRVGASVLAHLIESKCDDALPIHRQCDQFGRLGFDVPVDTLYGYWRYATDLLLPVADALLGTILAGPDFVAMDDTGIDVLDRHRKGGKYRGHLWCFRCSLPLVAFAFTKTWEAEEIKDWIHAIPPDVAIQVDDYGGYSAKLEDLDDKEVPLVPPDRRLGCCMHVRRRFHAAYKIGDKRAAFALGIFKGLYEIERECKDAAPEVRERVRRERSLPLLDELDHWVDEHEAIVGKTGKLAEAVRYAKQQRPYIRRCFSDGRYEIDNGAVERSIRKPAVGRKNFLFTGSAAAGRRLAAAYSLVLTCRELGLSTRDYLIDVLEKLEGGWPMRRLVELLPHRWGLDRGMLEPLV